MDIDYLSCRIYRFYSSLMINMFISFATEGEQNIYVQTFLLEKVETVDYLVSTAYGIN